MTTPDILSSAIDKLRPRATPGETAVIDECAAMAQQGHGSETIVERLGEIYRQARHDSNLAAAHAHAHSARWNDADDRHDALDSRQRYSEISRTARILALAAKFVGTAEAASTWARLETEIECLHRYRAVEMKGDAA